MRLTQPQYFYHLTTKQWPRRLILTPRSNGELGINCERPEDEPEIARICVGPSIPHCLSALRLCSRFNIYRTLSKVKARYPYRVCDAYLTKERWLIRPTTFIQVGILDSNLISQLRSELSNGGYNPVCIGNLCELHRQEKYARFLHKWWNNLLKQGTLKLRCSFKKPARKSCKK